MRLGLVLVALTGVNVYVFFFRDDTAVRKLLQPSSMIRKLSPGGGKVQQPQVMGDRGAATTAPLAVGQDEEGRTIEGKFGPSDYLGTVLVKEGLGAQAGEIIRALSRFVDPRLIRPGDGYAIYLDAEGTPEYFEYHPSPVLRYVVKAKAGGTWLARKEETPLEIRVAEASGTIDVSLYDSAQKAGESGALAPLFVDLFAWDLNFYVDTHPGDHWKVVVEKQFLGGQFFKYGRVLAAEYGGKAGTFRAFYWNPTPGHGEGRYYDEHGLALAKTMLKSPLRYVRVSSKFDLKRFHPILHRMKAHLGVDYAAPTGTPVWAPMAGRVVEVGMKPGSGNTVVLAHGNGLNTRYYHLSRFAKGLKAGEQLRQKELIGYVGTTGLSTGPHLHFSVTKNDGFIDPNTLKVTREAPVADRAAFLAGTRARVLTLRGLPPAVANNE